MAELNTNFIKTLYFYVIVAGCVLFLALGTYWLVRANLIRHIFTEADDMSYYSGIRKPSYYECQSILSLAVVDMSKTGNVEPQLTEDQIKTCKEELAKEEELQKTRRYQNDMVSSTLMILISGIVLTIHLKFVRPRQ